MDLQINKTLSLIRRSYNQPIIFHILHSHLAFLLKKKNQSLNAAVDDYEKIIVASATENNLLNQGIEIKILQELKSMKRPLVSKKNKLKLITICYYMLTRPASLINHIILFELVSNFLNISDYFDGLIIGILNKITIGKIYGVPSNKKIKNDIIERMIEIVSDAHLCDVNKIKFLVSFIKSSRKPLDLTFVNFEENFFGYKCLDYISFYVKFTQNTDHIKQILPNNLNFLTGIRNYMEMNFNFEITTVFSLKNCIIEDKQIFDEIKDYYDRATNKEKFISDLHEFIKKLKK